MQSFAAYRNLVEIGRGGMATVYRATAPNGNLVALKVLGRHLSADSSARLRFQQESRLELVHPNIVHVLQYGIEGDVPYIVMEYVVGESLDRLILRRGRLTPEELLPILTDTARALDHAHKRGVIHRDVKPSNILIRTNGQAMLADFGVAKIADLTAYTATAARIGSAFYMSPEQAAGAMQITASSDIYSLGVTAYYVLSGRHPFEGDNEIAIARMHLDTPPRPLHTVNPSIPLALSGVVAWALAKRPTGRPESAGQFVHEFERALRSPQTAPAMPLNGGLTSAGPVPLPVPAAGEQRSLTAPALGVLALVLIGLAMLASVVALSSIDLNRRALPTPGNATQPVAPAVMATLEASNPASTPPPTLQEPVALPVPTAAVPTSEVILIPPTAPGVSLPPVTLPPLETIGPLPTFDIPPIPTFGPWPTSAPQPTAPASATPMPITVADTDLATHTVADRHRRSPSPSPSPTRSPTQSPTPITDTDTDTDTDGAADTITDADTRHRYRRSRQHHRRCRRRRRSPTPIEPTPAP